MPTAVLEAPDEGLYKLGDQRQDIFSLAPWSPNISDGDVKPVASDLQAVGVSPSSSSSQASRAFSTPHAVLQALVLSSPRSCEGYTAILSPSRGVAGT